MNFLINTNKSSEIRTDCLILPVFEDGILRGASKTINSQNNNLIKDFQSNGDISGKLGQTRILPINKQSYKRIVLVGCGKFDKYFERNYKKAITSALKKLSSTSHKNATNLLASDDLIGKNDELYYRASRIMVESWYEITYQYTATNSKKEKKYSLSKLYFGTNGNKRSSSMSKGLKHGESIGSAIQKVKYLGDLPANICTPSFLVKETRKIANKNKSISLKVLNESDMKKLKMGSLLSVTAGASEPAKLIVAEYKGSKSKSKPIVIVGKGITFDTGGVSLKPSNGMDEMKYDMCGAATTIGLLQMVSELKLSINAVFIVPACENVVGSRATKPGDIVTAMSGTTIEVLNTDAEGRLILADALTYAQKFKPELIIDMATLTGACVVALGKHMSGFMTNSESLANELSYAGEVSNDQTWRLPLNEDYAKQIKSNFADVANISTNGVGAGTITAGCFLQKFVGDYDWAHIDIAGVAWLEGSNKGATGRPVAMVSEFLINRALN
ncbi:leucyl aminopeptidase [Gammaproteobacteria bacterium]|nr:leucyl aminopeptidase [Gammaproteobacteria bacterium]